LLAHARVKSVEGLHLDESAKIGYTYKCVGSGIYYMRTAWDFKQARASPLAHPQPADARTCAHEPCFMCLTLCIGDH
jgi:hypothetical protein